MAKIPEAEARLHKNVFVCKNCKRKVRAQPLKVIAGKARCRHCKSNALRPVRKK